MMSYIKSPNDFRNLISGVNTKVPLINGEYVNAINFDNAATTPPLISVLEEIMNFSPWYSSVHRGAGYKSQFSSGFYENARDVILDFVGGDPNYHSIVFVKNTTEGINKISNRLLEKYKDGVVLSTCMEHHSNDLPWRDKYKIDYIAVDHKGRLSFKDLENKLSKYDGEVKLVTVTGASNVTGYINDIHKIAKLVHNYGAEILVDGAQLVPHAAIDMKKHGVSDAIDYLVFSGHKMYAPFGTGVLIAPKKVFEKGAPDYSGGGTVELVTHDYIRWNSPPWKDEAGTPNVMGVVAIVASIKILQEIGMDNIQTYESQLMEYTIEGLKRIPDIELLSDTEDINNSVSIIPFNMKEITHEMLANILSYEAGIAVRNGCFCAQPYLHKLLKIPNEEIERRIADRTLPHPGVVRISFGLYNNYQEIDILLRILYKISSNKEYYINKYKSID